MVERVYGHLSAGRHRSEVVEYWVAQHTAAPGARLTGAAPDLGAALVRGMDLLAS